MGNPLQLAFRKGSRLLQFRVNSQLIFLFELIFPPNLITLDQAKLSILSSFTSTETLTIGKGNKVIQNQSFKHIFVWNLKKAISMSWGINFVDGYLTRCLIMLSNVVFGCTTTFKK